MKRRKLREGGDNNSPTEKIGHSEIAMITRWGEVMREWWDVETGGNFSGLNYRPILYEGRWRRAVFIGLLRPVIGPCTGIMLCHDLLFGSNASNRRQNMATGSEYRCRRWQWDGVWWVRRMDGPHSSGDAQARSDNNRLRHAHIHRHYLYSRFCTGTRAIQCNENKQWWWWWNGKRCVALISREHYHRGARICPGNRLITAPT